MYYLIRTGHVKEAASVAVEFESAISRHEELFTTFLKAWAESLDRRQVDNLDTRLFAYTSSLDFHLNCETV